jgi:hypothetical protein
MLVELNGGAFTLDDVTYGEAVEGHNVEIEERKGVAVRNWKRIVEVPPFVRNLNGLMAFQPGATPPIDSSNGAVGSNEGTVKTKPSFPPTASTDKTVGRGWYAVDLPQSKITGDVRVQLEFVSSNGDKERYKLIQADERSGPNVAWIYFDQPGSLAISASVLGSPPKLRNTGFAELISKSREIGFAKVELTVFLLCEILPLAAWILGACLLQIIVDWAIGKLPRMIRGRTRHEIEMMLTFAKWAVIVCYVVWTGKDILAGIAAAK